MMVLLTPALLLLAGGCGRSDFELAPVTGTVRIDGTPLGAGKVMFAPVAQGGTIEAGKPAIGRLQDDGTFVLSTYEQEDGAVVGSHWVTIYGPGKEGRSLPAGVPAFDRMTVREGTKEVIAGQDNHFEIDISSEEIRKFARKPG